MRVDTVGVIINQICIMGNNERSLGGKLKPIRRRLRIELESEYLLDGFHSSKLFNLVDVSISSYGTIDLNKCLFEKHKQFVEVDSKPINLHLLFKHKAKPKMKPIYVCVFLAKEDEDRFNKELTYFSKEFVKGLRKALYRLGGIMFNVEDSNWKQLFKEAVDNSVFTLAKYTTQTSTDRKHHTSVWNNSFIPEDSFFEDKNVTRKLFNDYRIENGIFTDNDDSEDMDDSNVSMPF